MTKTLQLGNHLAAFLDVLGQRERFSALHHPTTLTIRQKSLRFSGRQRALCWSCEMSSIHNLQPYVDCSCYSLSHTVQDAMQRLGKDKRGAISGR